MWKPIAPCLAVSLLTLSPCVAEENASNPLSKVKNTDVRAQYFDNPDGSYRWDLWLESRHVATATSSRCTTACRAHT